MIGGLTSTEACSLCENYKLTIKQLWYLYLFYTNDIATVLRYASKITDYNTGKKDSLTSPELKYLVEEDFLRKLDGSKIVGIHSTELADIDVSAPFVRDLWIKTNEAGYELIDAYPDHMSFNGTLVWSKTGDKDTQAKKYCVTIKHNRKKHNQIMELLNEWKKNNEYATMKLDNFINSEAWNGLISIPTSDYGKTIL